MTTNELYYLLLVCGAFATFALSLAIGTWQYRRWLKRGEGSVAVVPPTAAPVLGTPARRVAASALAR